MSDKSIPVDPGVRRRFKRRLLAWFRRHGRDLPWRRTREPWAILVSEVMLQQTQVARVVPKWHAFLQRFPDPTACAAAPVGAVVEAWAGLGYNRRGVALHRCATVVVADHRGELPLELDALLALPGIGPYTARAVLAFAFARDVGVVDTNIARVLARTAGERLTAKVAQQRADRLVPHGEGWLWNQALMDLGATVCRPAPRCGACPLAPSCAWWRAGATDPDPAIGSAGVSGPQAPYAGSRREARGAVLRAVHDTPRPVTDFDASIVAELAAEGLVTVTGDTVHLPH